MKLSSKINRIKTYKDIDNIRYELYAVFSALILDKQIFNSNKELKPFMQKFSQLLGYHFEKDYLFASRTNVVAQAISRLKKSDGSTFDEIITIISVFINENEEDTEQKSDNRKSDPDLDRIIEKFTR